MKKLPTVPLFSNEDEERAFWAIYSPLDFPQYKPTELNLSQLKRSTRTVTIRMTESLLNQIKILALKQDVPYQSLMKVMLSEKIAESVRARS